MPSDVGRVREGAIARCELAETARIVFTPSGRRGEVPVGTSVLNAARQLGVDLGSVCGGVGLCGRCQVTPMFGDFPKHGINVAQSALTEYTNTETDYAARKGLGQDRRLGCMADIRDDVVVDIPSTSQVHRQVIRKELELVDLVIDENAGCGRERLMHAYAQAVSRGYRFYSYGDAMLLLPDRSR